MADTRFAESGTLPSLVTKIATRPPLDCVKNRVRSPLWKNFAKTIVFSCVALLGSAGIGNAELIAEDDFSKYTEGAPPDVIGGKGWKSRWSVGPEAVAVIQRSPGIDGVPKNCLKVSGKNTARALMRRIANPQAATGEPIYLRVVFEVVASPTASADVFSSWTFTSDPAALSASVSTGLKNPPSVRIGESRKALPEGLTAGRIHTLVAKLGGWNESTKQYTDISLWIDPKPDADEADQGEVTQLFGDAGSGIFELIVFRIHDLMGGAYRLFDVRLATTWDEVVLPR